jgi:hypothetical protein
MNGSFIYDEFMKSGLHREIDHNEFSKRLCENCGELPGERFTIEGYFNLNDAKSKENLYQIDICISCHERLFGGDDAL